MITKPVKNNALKLIVLSKPARSVVIRHEEAYLGRIHARLHKLPDKTSGRANHRETLPGRSIFSSNLEIPLILHGQHTRFDPAAACRSSYDSAGIIHIGEIQYPVFRGGFRAHPRPENLRFLFFRFIGSVQAINEGFNTCNHTRIGRMFIHLQVQVGFTF